jgi:hypothetical protein
VENASGTDGIAMVYNAAYMHNDLAIAITAPRWMTVAPGTGTVEPFSSDTVTVTFNSGNLGDGVYHGQVAVTGNDPNNPSKVIPVLMTLQSYVCGDANGDTKINSSDAVYIISYIFRSGSAPQPLAAADANGDGKINTSDAVYLISYIFRSGPAPICP